MPRVRKPRFAGVHNKLAQCFNLLLSGASGECLAGELGCCGDSCCSSALVSRALAEYCAHSNAARRAFAAARGLDAMQAALTRGSPAVATAAARVLSALCSSPDGLHTLLQWQGSNGSSCAGGSDVLAALAGAAGCGSLPPELRAECVEALRCALGSLHGPAGGGGVQLAELLQAAGGSNTAGAAGRPGAAGGLLGQVALPPLLSNNLHLRAAAARLIALAADEGLLLTEGESEGGGGGGEEGWCGRADSAAAVLGRALGLGPSASSAALGRCERGGRGAAGPSAGEDGDVTAAGEEDTASCGVHREGNLRVLALCELVAALLAGRQASWRLFGSLGAAEHVLTLLAGEWDGVAGGDERRQRAGGGKGPSTAVREALLDGLLLCLRAGPDKLWGPEVAVGGGSEAQGRARAFAVRLGTLLNQQLMMMLVPAGHRCGNTAIAAASAAAEVAAAADEEGGLAGCSRLPVSLSVGTAASLAAALSSWPQALLMHPEVAPAVTSLISRLCDVAVLLLPPSLQQGPPDRMGYTGPDDDDDPQMDLPGSGPVGRGAQAWPQDWDWDHQTQGPTTRSVASSWPYSSRTVPSAAVVQDTSMVNVRAAASAVTAAVELYGALHGSRVPRSLHEGDGMPLGTGSHNMRYCPDLHKSGAGGAAAAEAIRPAVFGSYGEVVVGSREADMNLAGCLERMAAVVRDGSIPLCTAVHLLSGPLSALVRPPLAPLAALLTCTATEAEVTSSTTSTTGISGAAVDDSGGSGTGSSSFLLHGLGQAATALVSGLLSSNPTATHAGAPVHQQYPPQRLPYTSWRSGGAATPPAWGLEAEEEGEWSSGCVGGSSPTTTTTIQPGWCTAPQPPAPAATWRDQHAGSTPGLGHGEEEQTALRCALEVWTLILAAAGPCSCCGLAAGTSGDIPQAGGGGGGVCDPGCVACMVRPAGALGAVAAGAERLVLPAGSAGPGTVAGGKVGDTMRGATMPEEGAHGRAGSGAEHISGSMGAVRHTNEPEKEPGAGEQDDSWRGSRGSLSDVELLMGLSIVAAAAVDVRHVFMDDASGECGVCMGRSLQLRLRDVVRLSQDAVQRHDDVVSSRVRSSGGVNDEIKPLIRGMIAAETGETPALVEDGEEEDLVDAEAILDECLSCVNMRAAPSVVIPS